MRNIMRWDFAFFLTIVQSSLWLVLTRQDSIAPGNSITGSHAIISASGRFALGFFSPGKSTRNYYLAVWYHMIPMRTVVWVANRETPLDSPGIFTVGRDGNLVVFDSTRNFIWSSNVSISCSAMNNTSVVLMDTGNLVLKVGEDILWQSFDYPSDTLLPGMKLYYQLKSGKQWRLTSWTNEEDPRPGMYSVGIDPKGLPQLYIWKGNQPFWRSTVYHDNLAYPRIFPGGITISLISGLRDGEMYFGYNITSKSPVIESRFWSAPNGQLKMMIWMEHSSYWLPILQLPLTYCDLYGQCGPSGCCDQNQVHDSCNCLTGFEPKNPENWSNGIWIGGCVRQKKLTCNNADEFLKVGKTKLPDYSFPMGRMSLSGCESKCRQNCSCTAFTLSGAICLNWYGDLLDLLQNSIDGTDLYIRVHESVLIGVDTGEDGNFTNPTATGAKRWLLVVALPISMGGILLLTSIPGCLLWRKRSAKRGRFEESMTGTSNSSITTGVQSDVGLIMFSLRSISAATENFSKTNKLGEGGFGPVYKGNSREKGEVAIKRLSHKSRQGLEEFMNELKLIARLQHKNLVRLLGCCVEEEEKILIYEYMPNRSLDKCLFGPSEKASLDWSKRFHIIEGVAQGLLYLHKYSRVKVIHRDLKASNILLDREMNPKISDFGMAKNFDMNQIEANTNRVVGTYGYMSPEYALYGQFSEKSDVFSFGVLLLEIVSGKKNTDFNCDEIYLTLLGWAWKECIEGRELEIVDPAIRDTCCLHEAEKCIKISLLCVQELPMDRPTMSSIVLMLENQNAPLQSPKQPAFCKRVDTTASCYSYNMGTMSVLEAR